MHEIINTKFYELLQQNNINAREYLKKKSEEIVVFLQNQFYLHYLFIYLFYLYVLPRFSHISMLDPHHSASKKKL